MLGADFFGDLDTLYEKLDQVEFLSIRGAKSLAKKLEAGREDAYLARRLTTIVRDAEMDATDIAWQGADRAAIEELVERVGLPQGIQRAALKLAP